MQLLLAQLEFSTGDHANHNATFVPKLLAFMIKARHICKPRDQHGICNVTFITLFTFSEFWVEFGK